jgi:hypothetical protein
METKEQWKRRIGEELISNTYGTPGEYTWSVRVTDPPWGLSSKRKKISIVSDKLKPIK